MYVTFLFVFSYMIIYKKFIFIISIFSFYKMKMICEKKNIYKHIYIYIYISCIINDYTWCSILKPPREYLVRVAANPKTFTKLVEFVRRHWMVTFNLTLNFTFNVI